MSQNLYFGLTRFKKISVYMSKKLSDVLNYYYLKSAITFRFSRSVETYVVSFDGHVN